MEGSAVSAIFWHPKSAGRNGGGAGWMCAGPSAHKAESARLGQSKQAWLDLRPPGPCEVACARPTTPSRAIRKLRRHPGKSAAGGTLLGRGIEV